VKSTLALDLTAVKPYARYDLRTPHVTKPSSAVATCCDYLDGEAWKLPSPKTRFTK
jgi:hypothetical protein